MPLSSSLNSLTLTLMKNPSFITNLAQVDHLDEKQHDKNLIANQGNHPRERLVQPWVDDGLETLPSPIRELLPSFNTSWLHPSSRPRDLFHPPSHSDVPQRALSLPSQSTSSVTLWKKTKLTVGTPNSKVEDLPLNTQRCFISSCHKLCNPSHPGFQPV